MSSSLENTPQNNSLHKMSFYHIYGSLFMLLTSSHFAFAWDGWKLTVPPVGGTSISNSSKVSFSLTYFQRRSDQIFEGSRRVSNSNNVTTSFENINLTTAWKINDHFILSGTLPWLSASRSEDSQDDTSFSGIGDASLSLRWSPSRKGSQTSNTSLHIGFIFPTGETENQPQTGALAPSVFQAGTGTFQATLGLDYSRRINGWLLGGSLNSSFPLHESSDNFRPAATYTASVFTGRSLSENINFRISTDLVHNTNDVFQGNDIEDTGSTTLSIKPAIIWNINESFSTSASVSVPVWRDVNSTQIAVGPIWSIGVSRNF